MMSLHHPRGGRLVRTRITRSTGAHCGIGVTRLCTLHCEVDCADLILGQSFRNPVTKEKYHKTEFQFSIIPHSADLEFIVNYRGKQLGKVKADYAENLPKTTV